MHSDLEPLTNRTTMSTTSGLDKGFDEPRFGFGENWRSFLKTVNQPRIEQAIESLQRLFGVESFHGQTFLDLGCGSGIFSLAAVRMGASVTSLDYDQNSVLCTEELRRRYGQSDGNWIIRRGDVLDHSMMSLLGKFDVVYSWGVLHHTGDMNTAIDSAAGRVRSGGLFSIAIYNDQGGGSRRWLWIKQTYHRLPPSLRSAWVILIAGIYEAKFAMARLARGNNPLPFTDWRAKRLDRGMSVWHDWVDWIGGLPFEVAAPESIILPLIDAGFALKNLKTVGAGWGCNEFTFLKKR